MRKILLIILLLIFSFGFSYADKQVDVKIGVLAKRGVTKALQKWEPTAKYLNDFYPQYNFVIVPMKFDDIPVLVSNSLVDFVIVNSGIYVDLSVKHGVNRISTLKNHLKTDSDVTKFGSVVFVKKNSSINSFLDIKYKRVAAVHKTSFGGWIMAQREMEDEEVYLREFKKLDYLNTHDSVVLSVLSGEHDVGIVRTDTLERMANEKKITLENIKVINKKEYKDFPFLSSSRLYPEWPIARLNKTDKKIAKDIVLALMQMESDSIAAKASKINGWTIPEDYSSVHNILKKLNITPYEDYGKITIKLVFEQYWKWLVFIIITFGSLVVLTIFSLKLNTNLKKEQSKLIRNEERFRSTFDQAGIGIVHINFDGDFIRVNQQFCQLVKRSSIEVRNLNFSDFIYVSDLVKITQSIGDLKHSNNNTSELNIRLNSSENDTVWVVLTLSKVLESTECKPYLVVTIVDISKIKKLEEKMKNEKLQKEMILNIAGDGILSLDSQAKHTFANIAASKLLGYEVEEMIGKDSHKMWHHSYEDGTNFPDIKCPITAVLKDGITHRGHNEVFWKKDGTPIKVDFISTPIKEDGEIVGTVVLFRESNPTFGTIETL